MHQKISDFELIIDENSKEHIEALKNIKSEMEIYKAKNFENEKFLDILNYFFKKMQIIQVDYDNKEGPSGTSKPSEDNFRKNFYDLKTFQNKLIELENFIIKILNEKNLIQQKYSKILEIQNKIANSESNEHTRMHLENIKKLNEKIFDLTEENNYLKKQKELESDYNTKKDSYKLTNDFEHLEKENIFTNNYIKDNLNRGENNHVNYLKNDRNKQSNGKKSIERNFKTLEERVLELERELNSRERDRQLEWEDNSYSINSIKNISNKKVRRSKSSNKMNSICENDNYNSKITSNSPRVNYTKSNTSEIEESENYFNKENKKEKKKVKNFSKTRYKEIHDKRSANDKSAELIDRKDNMIEKKNSHLVNQTKKVPNILKVGIRK